ncbi:hypothetical protein GCM10009834_46750 [Streptomonospora arabica]
MPRGTGAAQATSCPGEARTLPSGPRPTCPSWASCAARSRPRRPGAGRASKPSLRGKALGGDGDDPLNRAVGAMGLLADRVGAVETAIERAADRMRAGGG